MAQYRKTLSMQWLKNVASADREKTEKAIRHSTIALGILKSIIEDEYLKGILAKETTESAYEYAAWPYYRADLDGQKKAYRRILELLSFI